MSEQTVEQKAVQLVKTAGDAIEAAGRVIDEYDAQKKAAAKYIDEIVALAKRANLLENPGDEDTIRIQLQNPAMTSEILKHTLTHVVKGAESREKVATEFGEAVSQSPSQKQASTRKQSDLAMLRLAKRA